MVYLDLCLRKQSSTRLTPISNLVLLARVSILLYLRWKLNSGLRKRNFKLRTQTKRTPDLALNPTSLLNPPTVSVNELLRRFSRLLFSQDYSSPRIVMIDRIYLSLARSSLILSP